MLAYSSELRLWVAAGVELPDDLAELSANLQRCKRQKDAIETDFGPTTAAEKFAAGADVSSAVELTEEEAAELTRRHELRKAAAAGVELAARRLARAVAESRDRLIVTVARPVVDELLAAARPAVDKTARFEGDPAKVAAGASASELKAWQELVGLEQRFAPILAAWRASMKTARRSGSYGPKLTVDVAEAAGLELWQHPEHVSERMRGRSRGDRGQFIAAPITLANIAAEPEAARFRLAGIDELNQAVAEQRRNAQREAAPARRRGARMIAL